MFQPSVAASVRATTALTNTGDTLDEGSFLTKGFGNRTYGSVALSELSGEFELTTEDGRSYVTEESVSSVPNNLISETYERGVTATGTATHFEFDFNNLIVLEPDWTYDIVQLEDGTGNLSDEYGYDVILENQVAKPEVGVIELESGTPEENSIILESDDSDVILLLQQEDGSKIFTEEDIHTIIPDPARLCNIGLHDLLLEEEGILQEAVDQIKLEDFTLDNVTQEEFILGQFVPYLVQSHEDCTLFLISGISHLLWVGRVKFAVI